MNILAQVSVDMFLFLLGQYLEVGLVGQRRLLLLVPHSLPCYLLKFWTPDCVRKCLLLT